MQSDYAPPWASSYSVHELGERHLRALQSIRDETVVLFSALELAPEEDLRRVQSSLPKLIQTPEKDFETLLRTAKLQLIRNALRRVLHMNAVLVESLFSKPTEIRDLNRPASSGADTAANRNLNLQGKKGVVELFREKLVEAGCDPSPAATLASLSSLERILAEEVEGLGQRPESLNLHLLEVDEERHDPGRNEKFQVKTWHQNLGRVNLPAINLRLLESIFTTAIVSAHEALQTYARIPRKEQMN